VDPHDEGVGKPEDVRRWAENRRLANAIEVRDLIEYWGEPDRSVQALFELLDLWAAIHGWPPPEDPIDVRDDLVVWERFARLRGPYAA
jgi:hypothetical protein